MFHEDDSRSLVKWRVSRHHDGVERVEVMSSYPRIWIQYYLDPYRISVHAFFPHSDSAIENTAHINGLFGIRDDFQSVSNRQLGLTSMSASFSVSLSRFSRLLSALRDYETIPVFS